MIRNASISFKFLDFGFVIYIRVDEFLLVHVFIILWFFSVDRITAE